jgi:hypothetical protein
MGRTREQLEAEVRATVKLIMTDLEALRDEPDAGVRAVYWDESRRRIMRQVWALFRACMADGVRV